MNRAKVPGTPGKRSITHPAQLRMSAAKLLLEPGPRPQNGGSHYFDLCIGGLARETYEAIGEGVEELVPCGNPDCDCLVWSKTIIAGSVSLTLCTSDELAAVRR